MSSLACDIVLLPSSDIARSAIRLSNILKSHDSYFTLKEGEYFPHASLYMTQLKEADFGRVGEVLAEIAKNISTISATPIGYEQSEGFISMMYERGELLNAVQNQVVEAINPIRDGLRLKDAKRLEEATGKERENLEMYGYRSVGELFDLHITLTRFKSPEPVDTNELETYLGEFNGYFTKLGLFEMGDNGTCVRKIAEFTLGTE